MSQAIIGEHQPSMTEWFAAIGEQKESEAFRQEDLKKQPRLEILFQTIGLPYERPEIWEATDINDTNPAFLDLLKIRGNDLCAFRLVPKKPDLEKIRNRGQSIQDCYETWFKKLTINPKDYIVEICPHSNNTAWATIFVVNDDMIFGEMIEGLHNQLTQGNTLHESYQFQFDYKEWRWSKENSDAQTIMKQTIAMLHVENKTNQQELEKKLDATFCHGYLAGYFETTVWDNKNTYFIDYNRLLSNYFKTPPKLHKTQITPNALHGTPAFAGKAKGNVVIVPEDEIATVAFEAGSILVCDNTDVRYLPLMRKAAAIITNRGGMLSHAAIVARELKVPCLVGVRQATDKLETGDLIEVDSALGIIRQISKVAGENANS